MDVAWSIGVSADTPNNIHKLSIYPPFQENSQDEALGAYTGFSIIGQMLKLSEINIKQRRQSVVLV